MKVLFLNPPSFKRYDGAGTRYQATRKTKSLFYPVWLSYAAGLLDESKVLDCPAEGIGIDDVRKLIYDYNLVVLHTTTPTILKDLTVAESLKEANANIRIVLVGPHVSVLPGEMLRMSSAVDAVARKEFDYTILELAKERRLSKIKGLSWKKNGQIIHNPDRSFMESLDKLPFVSRVYRRDLPISSYRLPQILHPYVSIYTGRGCPYRCTFCLWPQTFLGRRYRVRSPQNVAKEIKFIKSELPQVKEILFEDDTFTALPSRVEKICDLIKPMDASWSANARADVKYETLKKMKEAGCRLLIVGYESGSQEILNNVRKGITIERMKKFTRDCHKLGIMLHGCFIFGLPGETKETIKKTIDFAMELDCDTIQGAVATPFPGTEFYDYCQKHGYLRSKRYIDEHGYQESILDLPSLSAKELVDAVDDLHVKYYYRIHYIYKILKQTTKDPREIERILKSGSEFQQYIIKRLFRRVKTSILRLTTVRKFRADRARIQLESFEEKSNDQIQ